VLKEFQRHPVRGEMMHVDFVRVRMDVAIQTTVVVELEGVDESPGTSEGGVLEQTLRELTVEALPGDVPETIAYDASGLEAGATVTVADLKAPANVTIVDDPEAVVASITLPKLEVETDDVETETALVGEDGEPLPEGAEGADGDDSPDASGSGDGEQPDTTEQ
jgi:large subunit ribosomal protein L25